MDNNEFETEKRKSFIDDDILASLGWDDEAEQIDLTENSNATNKKHNPNEPKIEYDEATGKYAYVDKNMEKIKQLRQKLKTTNVDRLAERQNEMINGLMDETNKSAEQIKSIIGKTGNSHTGKVCDEEKQIGKLQSEYVKEHIINTRLSQGKI